MLFCYNETMQWLANINKDTLTILSRSVSPDEVKRYQRQTSLSLWSLGVDISQKDMAILAAAWALTFFGIPILVTLTPYWYISVIMTAASIVISLAMFSRAYDRSIRRHIRLHDFAAQNALRYDPIGQVGAVGVGLLFDVGHSRRYRGVLSCEHDGQRTMEIGRYQYTVGSGKHQQTYTWRYAAVRLPRKVPHMVLDAKQNNASLMNRAIFSNLPVILPNSQRITLEGNFDDYFTLYGPKKYDVDVRYVLTPDVMVALIDASSHFDVELVDDLAFFYTVDDGKTDVDVIGDMLTVLEVVGHELYDQTDRYADDRVDDARQKNAVAEQGRRLRSWKL